MHLPAQIITSIWPSLAANLLNHLWQSTLVGLVILVLLSVSRHLPAATRLALAWVGLAKFIIPGALFTGLIEGVAHLARLWLSSQGAATLVGVSSPLTLVTVPAARLDSHPALVLLAFAVWAGGGIVLFSRWLLRARSIRKRILNTSVPLPAEMSLAIAAAASRRGLQPAPKCLYVGRNEGPAVLGIVSPVILLPEGLAETLSAAELETVIVHEFVHLRRRDNLWSLLQAFLTSLFWFHPVVWLLNRCVFLETEKACDERVVTITDKPEIYADGILKTVTHSLGLALPGLVGAAIPPVTSRLQNILACARRRKYPAARRMAVACGFLVLVSGTYLGTIVRAESPASAGPTYELKDLDVKPKVLTQAHPVYPKELRENGVTGEAMIEFIVDENGVVRDVRVLKSMEPGFATSAAQAVSKWTFSPGQKNGKPIRTRMQVPIRFEIAKN